MDIRVITIDFWDTLYRHTIRSSERRLFREQTLLRKSRELGLPDPENLSKTFFVAADKFVKSRWRVGINTKRNEILRNMHNHYGKKYPVDALGELLNVALKTYEGPLKPSLFPNGKEFLRWASQTWPVYLICDTFTVNGEVLDSVMRTDDVLKYFKARLYSDVLGKRKPERKAIDIVTKEEHVEPEQIIHIGDLLYTDFYMARRTGSNFILIRHYGRSKPDHDWSKSPNFLGEAESFDEVRGLVERLSG